MFKQDDSVYRGKESVKRVIVILVIIAVLVTGGIIINNNIHAAAANQTQYQVATADFGMVRKTVSATGTLQPWQTVSIRSKAGGKVDELLVDVGSIVHTGQVLAKIDPTDSREAYDQASASVQQATANTNEAKLTYQMQVQNDQQSVDNAEAALQAAQAKMIEAKANDQAQPAQTQAAIAQARAAYYSALKQRQELNSTNPQDVANTQASYNQDVANEKAAKLTLDRQISLAKQGFVPQQTVDTDQAAYDVSVAATAAAKEKLDTIAQQQQATTQASDAQVANARAALANAEAQRVNIPAKHDEYLASVAAYKQAQAALSQAKANMLNDPIKKWAISASAAGIVSGKAQLSDAKTTLDQTVVTSPANGVILVRDVSQGTIVPSALSATATGVELLSLGETDRMYVQATVDETDIANITVGQQVDVNFDAYPNMPFDGKVTRIDPQAVVSQNVTQFDVRVEIDNSEPTFRLLKPGMNATCDFVVTEKDNVLNVPSEAVQTDDAGNSYVQVATGGKTAPADPTLGLPPDPNLLVGVKVKRVTVQTGVEGDDSTEITSGLKQGDKVVTSTIVPVQQTPQPQGNTPFGGGGGGRGFGGGGFGGGRGR
jgi:multidrug efflux pump subunit AcrA (membrane-fusion protein)